MVPEPEGQPGRHGRDRRSRGAGKGGGNGLRRESPPLAEDGRNVSDLRRLPDKDEAGDPTPRTASCGRGRSIVKTISREDLKEKIESGDEFVLLEVLSEASYK